MKIYYRQIFLFVFFVCFFVCGNVEAQQIKQLPTCLDFSDVYSRTVLGTAPATKEEQEEMQLLASMMMGYVSALQDIYGNRLVGMKDDDNEWTLLEYVNMFCRKYPHMTFQRAVRDIPAVAQTIQSLQDEEFKRCTSYIEQTKVAICSPMNQKR